MRSGLLFLGLCIILIFILYLPFVFGQVRNLAPENIQNNTQEYNMTGLNIPPDRLDTKLIELVNEMQKAINITEKYDNKTAEQLSKLRDRFIQDALSGNIRDAQYDLKQFNDILKDFLLTNIESQENIPVEELLNTIKNLGSTDLSDIRNYQPINPPESVSPPKIGNISISSISPTPYIPRTPRISNSIFQMLNYVLITAGFITSLLLIYHYRNRISQAVTYLGERIGFKRSILQTQGKKIDFYRFFLFVAEKRGYPKKDCEGPVEHVSHIDNEELKNIGFEVAYTFEDMKYGYKKVEEERIRKIFDKIRDVIR